MKKIFLFLVMIMMTLSLVGCSNNNGEDSTNSNKNVQDHFYYYIIYDNDDMEVHMTSIETSGKTFMYKPLDIVENDKGLIVDMRHDNGIGSKEELDEISFFAKVMSHNSDGVIRKVIIDDEICLDSTSFLFSGFNWTEFYGLEKLNMRFNHNMAGMFADCKILQKLDVSEWNVSKVTNMMGMFSGCTQLQTLDISRWNVSKVTNMKNLFYNCVSLKTLDLSNWNVSNVTNMSKMFYGCILLQTLNVSKWNVSKVTNMTDMFDRYYQSIIPSWYKN